MHNQDIEDLAVAIGQVIPFVCKEWNENNLQLFETAYRGKSSRQIFAGRQTQEKTKAISPIIDEIFSEFIEEKLPSFEITEGKGKDYTINSTWVEWKNSLSEEICWTGNGYAKTNWHVLCKFILNKDGIIEKYFACIIPYDEMGFKWSDTGNSNFSTLNLLSEDYDKIIRIAGDFTKKPKYLYFEPVDYVSPT